MHYAFDAWMTREYPGIRFERYADDVVVHCVTERQARNLVAAIGDRMEQVGLRLHPDKTKIVYCKDQKRRLDYDGLTAFTFLGFTFRTRSARGKSGALFASFQPAISNDAQKKISEQIRRWRLHRRIGLTLADLARWINPVVRGWMQYYGAFYRSALYPLLSRINAYLMRWARKKYKRLRTIKKAAACWERCALWRAATRGRNRLKTRSRRWIPIPTLWLSTMRYGHLWNSRPSGGTACAC